MNLRYFDHNATTPMVPIARAVWLESVEKHWLNPSSPYRSAAAVKVRLEAAREEFAELFEVAADRVVFCSGATEANNAVFRNWVKVLPDGTSIAVSPTEHPSVIEAAKQYFGDRIVWLSVDANGVVQLAELERALEAGQIAAVSVMAANNETGVLQPWQAIAERCAKTGIAYHCDASQWVGKMPLPGLGSCGYVSGCAHKFGGPRGVGFLVLPDSDHPCKLLYGGVQESGKRAGTEDVAGIVSMLAALKATVPQTSLPRDDFIVNIRERIDGVGVVADGADCLWNTVALIMPEFQSVRWIRGLEKAGFLVSSGSACSSGAKAVSHVLLAMGIEGSSAARVLRISSGPETSENDWQALADALTAVHASLRADAKGGSAKVISID